MTISIASPARAQTTRDETERDAGFCRARSRLLRFAVRGVGRRPGVHATATTRTTTCGPGAAGPRGCICRPGRRGGRATARPANAGRLMRFVSPTWKPDTYGPVSISPSGRDTREPEPP